MVHRVAGNRIPDKNRKPLRAMNLRDVLLITTGCGQNEVLKVSIPMNQLLWGKCPLYVPVFLMKGYDCLQWVPSCVLYTEIHATNGVQGAHVDLLNRILA